MITSSLSYYDSEANHYIKKVYEKTREELYQQLTLKLTKCFESQIQLLKSQTFSQFQSSSKSLVIRRDVVNDQFKFQADVLVDQSIREYETKSKCLIVTGTDWGEKVRATESELLSQMRQQIDRLRDQEIEKLHNLTIKNTQDTIEELVNYPIYQIKDDFWKSIEVPLK